MKRSISSGVKIFSVFFCILFVASCGSDTSTASILEEKMTDDFTISIPSSWPLVSKDSDGVPTPSSGRLVLIASAAEPQNGFANNIVILENPTSANISSKSYALANIDGIQDQFYSYTQKESGDIVFADEEVSYVSAFSAQYNQNTPVVNYIQTARVCGTKAFVITVAVEKSIQDFSRYKEFISTFSCKLDK